MRARVLGEFRLESDGGAEPLPGGRVDELLRRLLLQPNEPLSPEVLIECLWPGSGDDAEARGRLHVVVSRLRRFLGPEDGGLTLDTVPGGYSLRAGPDALDRVAFEDLAGRALAGDPDLAAAALALWSGDPYTGFPLDDFADLQRLRLRETHQRLCRLEDARTAAWAREYNFAATRFVRPDLAGEPAIDRSRLLPGAADLSRIRLLAVVAPAGFGKSLLLSQLAEAHRGPTAWLSVEPGDDDPLRFWAAVYRALLHAGMPADTVAEGVTPGSSRFLGLLSDGVAALGPGVLLVCDDFAAGPDLAAAVVRWIAGLPTHVTVALASRAPLPVEVLSPREVRVITGRDLRFTLGEATQVAAQIGAPDAGAVEVADGWPIATAYLARLGRQGATDGAPLRDYVRDELMGDLPADLQRFMRATGILDRFTAPLCRAVTGDSRCGEHLERLLAYGIVVPDDAGGYRYLRLVHDALRAGSDGAERAAAGHQRAARWHREQGDDEACLFHALEAGDDTLAAAAAGDLLWRAMRRLDVASCRRCLDAIHPGILASDAASWDVAALAAAGWGDRASWLGWVRARSGRSAFHSDPFVLAIAARHRSFNGRRAEALALLRRALALVDERPAARSERPGLRPLLAAWLRAGIACERIWSGEVSFDDTETEATLAAAHAWEPVAAAWVLGEIAFLAYTAGRWATARDLVAGIVPASAEDTSASLAAPGAVVTAALLDSDAAPGAADQRLILDRLAPLVSLYAALDWNVHLARVHLAMHAVARRAGNGAAALHHQAHLDVLTALCDEPPLLAAARDRLDVGQAGPLRRNVGYLTPRERTVLGHIVSGLTYEEIAARLWCSTHTVRSHARSLFDKFGVGTRHELARAAGWRRGDSTGPAPAARNRR